MTQLAVVALESVILVFSITVDAKRDKLCCNNCRQHIPLSKYIHIVLFDNLPYS